MKNNDKIVKVKTPRAGKFNAMDVFIILIILLCIASLVYRYRVIDNIGVSENLAEYEIKFKIEYIREKSTQLLKEGDVVRFTESGEVIGTLNKPEYIGPAVEYIYEGKNPIEVTYPKDEKGDSIYEYAGSITVKGLITPDNKMFMLNGKTYLIPNSDIRISTENIETTIKVLAIVAK